MGVSIVMSLVPLGTGASSPEAPGAKTGPASGSRLGGGTSVSCSVCTVPVCTSSFLQCVDHLRYTTTDQACYHGRLPWPRASSSNQIKSSSASCNC